MTYNCEDNIDKYIASFSRTQKDTTKKKGLILPKMEDIATLEDELMDLFFPGLSGGETKSKLISVVAYHMENVTRLLYDSILLAVSYEDKGETSMNILESKTLKIVEGLADRFADIRNMLKEDAEAGYRGDPSANNIHEIILCYPVIRALAVHRVAHYLYKQGVPLIPKMMNEVMHQRTGIDIHPGAEIGRHFFIDHGTGVVIGETAVIGNNVKIYQGVTLGAISFPKDSCGLLLRGAKRHPTIEDNVTIYANASILGNITIGKGSIIGSSVWLKDSVPPCSIVTMTTPQIKIRKIDNCECCMEEDPPISPADEAKMRDEEESI